MAQTPNLHVPKMKLFGVRHLLVADKSGARLARVSLTVFGVYPQSAVLVLSAHGQPVGHSLLVQIEVLEMLVVPGGRVNAHPWRQSE